MRNNPLVTMLTLFLVMFAFWLAAMLLGVGTFEW